MTSHITTAALRVTITEKLTFTDAQGSGRDLDHTNYFDVADVAKFTRRIVTVSTTETGIVSFAATNTTAVGGTAFPAGYVAGHFDQDKVKFLRFTNKDDTNFVTMTFKNANDDEFQVIIDKGQTYFFCAFDDTGLVGTMQAEDQAPLAGALATLEDVTAQANTGAVDLEVFLAQIA